MLGSYVTGRFGTKGLSWRMAIGVSIVLAGMIVFRQVAGQTPLPFTAATLIVPLAICGFGMGMTISPLFQSVLQSVPAHDAGAGSGAMQAFQQVGAAVGMAVVSSLFFVRLHGQGGDDYAAALPHALTYQICAFSAILAILALRGRLAGRSPRQPVSGR